MGRLTAVPALAVGTTLLHCLAAVSAEESITWVHERPLNGRHCRDVLEGSADDVQTFAVAHLRACGFARLRNAMNDTLVRELHEAFLEFQENFIASSFLHAPLRERRTQYSVPFAFDGAFADLATLSANALLVGILQDYLGLDMTLDLATIVVVEPQVVGQEFHRDVQSSGSVAVQVPLHSLTEVSGPLTLCGGTHEDFEGRRAGLMRRVLQLTEERPNTPSNELLVEALCTDEVVAAPAEVGDIVIYDSRTFHRGSVNDRPSPRYALYLNYKNSSEHSGVHPDFDASALAADSVARHRAAFERRAAQPPQEAAAPGACSMEGRCSRFSPSRWLTSLESR